MAQSANKVWIVLVNWNGWRDSVECLESVLRLEYPDFGVIVCDNASSDGSVEHIVAWAEGRQPYSAAASPLARLSTPQLDKPLRLHVADPTAAALPPAALDAQLVLVRTGGNLGFAGGNNVGIRLALADPACTYVWLLNNDTVVEPDCLAHMMAKAASDSAIGITGSVNCFYAEPERVQALGGGYFSRRQVRSGLHGHRMLASAVTATLRRDVEARLEWVSGASMLVSRAFLEQVGEMEERYFLYYEEIDWALRSAPAFRHAVAFDARVYHKAGSSTGEQADSAFAIYTQYRSRFKLYRKFMPALLPICHLRTLRDCAAALVCGRRVSAQAIWKASRDDFLRL